ncbi:transferrin-binding protein-like solute binding protein [Oceanibium sediminis]|uniref:transferrin-binding protein-like solute binding protein n=1 Tax=Oceanibium sediminis TaxID=2026339 RepID=UPI000DD2D37F|nr:transferrin-binding protein-like solute binding protein [Oceanibium sediminis]
MRNILFLFCCGILISACSGGGDEGGPGAPAPSGPQDFTSWVNTPSDGTVRLTGAAKSAAYTFDFGTSSIDVGQILDDDDAYIEVTFKDGVPTRIVVGNTNAPIDINEATGAAFSESGLLVAGQTANGEDTIVVANPDPSGFQYQTFGLWATGYNTGAGTVGVGSFGSATPAADMPSGDLTATYNGFATGFVVNETGYGGTVSDIEIVADFGNSGVTIATSNTEFVDIDTLAPTGSAASMDYTGSGTMSGSGFTANVSSFVGSGTMEGQFYGPGAVEVGGTFSTDGLVKHVGSFGAN